MEPVREATRWTTRWNRRCGWMLLALALVCALPGRAAERVDLRSGFQIICDHQRAVNGAERLYLTRDGDSYVDVNPAEIVRTEPMPESMPEPMPQPASQPATPASKSTDHAFGSGRAQSLDVPALLAQASAMHHIDVDLLASVVRAESHGNARAVSRAGAQGLMQLMPQTAATLGVRNSFAPAQNIAAGTAYLDLLLDRYHDNVALALAAYNAGPEAVDKYHGIPPYPETRLYVARVLHDFNRRKRQLEHPPASAAEQASERASAPEQISGAAHSSH
jgi:hypothetical protein